MSYTIYSVNGPVVVARGGRSLAMLDMVYVGPERLIGEVVGIRGGDSIIQVYENTAGLIPGQSVETSGAPMSLKLGPGLLGGIFDGIGRPLDTIERDHGPFLSRGINISSLDPDRRFSVRVGVKPGDVLESGAVYACCSETGAIEHRFLVPPGVRGTVKSVRPDGEYRVDDPVAVLDTAYGEVSLTLSQAWPIRRPRPVAQRLPVTMPLVTGQRVIDTLFPLAKGGCAAIPGPFGAGKTLTQHQLAKWSDADIIVYIGCGERGNEMTQVLEEFSGLVDPRTNRPLSERTVLIANTSNMPVAAREASIYTGITIAEYYRDMGYHVAIMADSTSRWAEALREISGRLEEMPAEEGFPAYLPSRLAEFYERAGYVVTEGGAEGSVTIIGAVSPQGGDFSEPVTQNTRRFVRCFWALDRELAYARHFPAINWTSSYSEYVGEMLPWYAERYGARFGQLRQRLMYLLQEESKLLEIVRLIGADVLPEEQKLIVEAARVVRLGFLQQNAYHAKDTYVPMERQLRMMEVILHLFDQAKTVVSKSIPISALQKTGIFDEIVRMKYDAGSEDDAYDHYLQRIDACVKQVLDENL